LDLSSLRFGALLPFVFVVLSCGSDADAPLPETPLDEPAATAPPLFNPDPEPAPPADPRPQPDPRPDTEPEPEPEPEPDVEPEPEPDPVVPERNHVGLLAAWSLDEPSGSMAYDNSTAEPPLDLAVLSGPAGAWGDGAYAASAPARLQSSGPANAITQAIAASGALTLEAWITPQTNAQSGPARILSLSQSPTARNVTLAQDGTQLRLRLRTSTTDKNGVPEFSTPDGAIGADLTHIAVTRDAAGAVVVYVDGQVAATTTIAGDLHGWAPMPVVLANEATGDRPWLGKLHLAAIYDRALSSDEIAQNHAAGPDAALPNPTPQALPDPPDEPEVDPDCIVGFDPLNYEATPSTPSKTLALPLEPGVTYSRLELEYSFQPADWGGNCYNPVYSPPKSVPQFHTLLSLQRGMHWCKGGSLLGISARGPGKNQLRVQTHWKDPPHTGSGCGQSEEFEPIPTIKKALDPGSMHHVRVVYDTAASLVEVTIDGQTYTGTPLPGTTITPLASHPIAVRLSLPEWLECYDASGNHTDAAACCWIPSVGWTFQDLEYRVCK